MCQWQWITDQIVALNVLIVLVNILSQYFMSRVVYRFYIVDNKLHCFDNSFHRSCVQKVNCSHPIQLITIFLRCNLFHIFDALTFMLQETLTVFLFSIFIFLLQFLLWSHTLCCWNICLRKRGRSSCFVYVDTIVSNYTF